MLVGLFHTLNRPATRSSVATRALVLALATGLLSTSATAAAGASEPRSRYFTTSDGVRLHYLEDGSGPPLVFVPGWTAPAWIWNAQLEHFGTRHRVIALDPRGQGSSEKPAHGYHPDRRSRDVCELLEHLGNEPAVVAGWSIAVSEVLLCVQDTDPERIRAVVLVDHDINYDRDPVQAFRGRFTSLQTERQEWTRRFIESAHARPQPDEYLDALTGAALSMPTNAAAIMIANFMLLGPTDLGPALESVSAPTLAIYSSLGWAVDAAAEVRGRWPGIRVEVLDDTSHALFVDDPDGFNVVLENFLDSLPTDQ